MIPGASLFRDLNRLPATGRAIPARPVPQSVPAPAPLPFHFPAPRFVGSLPTAASAPSVTPSASVGTALVGPLAAATAAASHFPAPRFASAQVPAQSPAGNIAEQAQGQGPATSTQLDTSTLASALGALRAILGREGFTLFVQRAAYYSLGPPSALNAAAYGAGFLLDPVRYLYQQGSRLVIPGPPVPPIRGLLTEGAENAAATMLRLFQSSSIEQHQNYVRLRNASLLAQRIREGRISPTDPQVLRESQRLGIDIAALANGTLGQGPRPGGVFDALQEFVNQMNAVGAFTGDAAGGVMPGERGDP